MKTIGILALFCLAAVHADTDGLKCTMKGGQVPTDWIDMAKACVDDLENHVKEEVNAAMTYLAMGIHFAQDYKNRPGLSKFFLESANEEREHAIKIIEYLLLRGQLTRGVSTLINFPLGASQSNMTTGLDALKQALAKEAEITNKIKAFIRKCESPSNNLLNDYHMVDYFTAEFLDEQYKGERALATKISTLSKMIQTYDTFGEIMFDQKLLKSEL